MKTSVFLVFLAALCVLLTGQDLSAQETQLLKERKSLNERKSLSQRKPLNEGKPSTNWWQDYALSKTNGAKTVKGNLRVPQGCANGVCNVNRSESPIEKRSSSVVTAAPALKMIFRAGG